ncbi:MAG TPA: hypothetical protein VGP72_31160 [Planctomycetota bacterium]|jgi:hypothetical protein
MSATGNKGESDSFDEELRQALCPKLPPEADKRIREKLSTLPIPEQIPSWMQQPVGGTSAAPQGPRRSWASWYAAAAAVFLFVALAEAVFLVRPGAKRALGNPPALPAVSEDQNGTPMPGHLRKDDRGEVAVAPNRPREISGGATLRGDEKYVPPWQQAEPRENVPAKRDPEELSQLQEHIQSLVQELTRAINNKDYAHAQQLLVELKSLTDAAKRKKPE